jgi:hypothetical protein
VEVFSRRQRQSHHALRRPAAEKRHCTKSLRDSPLRGGKSRYRRIVILRRRIERELALSERDGDGQLRLGFTEIDEGREVFEYAVLVTSLDSEILSLGQLYRDRADCENSFDELKNQWGWSGFTTRDLKRCRLMAGCVPRFSSDAGVAMRVDIAGSGPEEMFIDADRIAYRSSRQSVSNRSNY